MQLLIGRELFPIPSSLPLCAFLISIFSNIIFCRENRRKTSEREMISRRLMHAPIRPADPAKKCGDRYLRLSSLRASRLVVRITCARDIPARASRETKDIYRPASSFCIVKSIFLISPPLPRKGAV